VGSVKLTKLCNLELRYTSLQAVDYEPGGQLYGTMEGRAIGDRLSGSLHLTNLAARRPDNVNLPSLRGLLTTDDGATVWLELDGIATLRSSDNARVFVTSCRFRSGDPAYRWLDTVVAVVEGVLDRVAVGGVARAEVYACEPTLSSA
jgi:hypothetical protein